MVEITATYEGQLHCNARHGPSGSTMSTDILEASALAYLAAINRLRSLSARVARVSPHAAV